MHILLRKATRAAKAVVEDVQEAAGRVTLTLPNGTTISGLPEGVAFKRARRFAAEERFAKVTPVKPPATAAPRKPAAKPPASPAPTAPAAVKPVAPAKPPVAAVKTPKEPVKEAPAAKGQTNAN